jgi:hypothetical protein
VEPKQPAAKRTSKQRTKVPATAAKRGINISSRG